MNLLPKDERFFELFVAHIQVVCQSAELLKTGLRNGYSGTVQIAKQMDGLERSGDEIIHQIFQRLQNTFITPLDPEDMQTLATSLDNVLDRIEDVTFRIVAYRLDPIPDAALKLAEMIEQSVHALSRALDALHKRKPVLDDCIEVNRLENAADEIERAFVAELFATANIDPLSLIKQKEIIEELEQATDRCEDVADVIQNVAVKNG